MIHSYISKYGLYLTSRILYDGINVHFKKIILP
jgi:hypothetical protein